MRRLAKVMLIMAIITMTTTVPCFCYDNKTGALDSEDMLLLTNQMVWMNMSAEEQFKYIIQYTPRINCLLSVPIDTFPAESIHMMPENDPAYGKACAYTDYGTGQIYMDMNTIAKTGSGGWAALYTLAHETRHLYQEKYQTIPLNPQSTIYNQEVYQSDPREIDANNFADVVSKFITSGKTHITVEE